jgi:hypothetical protein
MASQSFIRRGGSEAEYQIYRALYGTGRKEPQDFVYAPPGFTRLSFMLYWPRMGLKVGPRDVTTQLLGHADAGRVEFISPAAAIADGRGALLAAIGG